MRLKIWGKGLLKIIWVIFVILLVGLSFPQIYGMKCYSVMSGSMSPDLPVGSAIYVKEKEPEKGWESRDRKGWRGWGKLGKKILQAGRHGRARQARGGETKKPRLFQPGHMDTGTNGD